MHTRTMIRWLLFASLLIVVFGSYAWQQQSFAQSPATITNPWALRQGKATYYTATGLGNCSLPLPSDLLFGAMNNPDYATADYCGAMVKITGPLGSVTVQITDRCPECQTGHIDLSPQAFDRIARRVDGIVPITWQLISNPATTGKVGYHFKDGSNQWWTAVHLRNHRNAIAKFEYRMGQAPYKVAPRFIFNYFIAETGMGAGPYSFRTTDVYGNVIVDENIALGDNVTRPGQQQFPYVAPPGSATPTPSPTPRPTVPPESLTEHVWLPYTRK
ncbi:expansin EXLX1 family cellulose-binding protein [Herpetosiphon giganteus]|uniref:expansin EXLX1 family cellulose-binding protein n=1 Tax=Herpetosiphon giganteus TaxID=2029754 RepID=UPI001957787F|nr:expansin EXLX1 family cellulose-binding protein [Herpetosiphon giganteus]MBM7842648.1 expansin (peptidoglycan-binding protein) [Herpetosiphon giganteus]